MSKTIDIAYCNYTIHYRVIGKSGGEEVLLFSTTVSYGAAEGWLQSFAQSGCRNPPMELSIEKAWVRNTDYRYRADEILGEK